MDVKPSLAVNILVLGNPAGAVSVFALLLNRRGSGAYPVLRDTPKDLGVTRGTAERVDALIARLGRG